MILPKLKQNELIIMQYTEEEPEKGESDKYAGLGIGVAGLLAENLACHPFIILRRQCQVVTIMFMKALYLALGKTKPINLETIQCHVESSRVHTTPLTLVPVFVNLYRLNLLLSTSTS